MMGWHDVRSPKATAEEGVIQTVGMKVININHSSGEALTKYTSRNAVPSMMGWHDVVRSQKATAGGWGGCNPDSWRGVTLFLSVRQASFVFVVLSKCTICTFSSICRLFS